MTSSNVTTKPTNLVFAGGSVKGIAYVGAIAALFKLDLLDSIKNVGGTSAGAITALLLALGYTIEELRTTLAELDLSEFLDDQNSRVKKHKLFSFRKSSWFASGPSKDSSTASSALSEFHSNLGIYPGTEIRAWLETIIQDSTGSANCTIAQLQAFALGTKKSLVKPNANFRQLAVIGFNLNHKACQIFSSSTTPSAIVSDAVRISLSIPFLFCPWKYWIQNPAGERILEPEMENCLWIDGGIIQNYPLNIFDTPDTPKSATLGFYLTSEENKAVLEGAASSSSLSFGKSIESAWDYTKAILESAMYKTQQRHAHVSNNPVEDCARTVYIPHLGISTLAFNLSSAEKNSLIVSGWDSVMNKLCSGVNEPILPCPEALLLRN